MFFQLILFFFLPFLLIASRSIFNRTTVYIDGMSSWYDYKSHKQLLHMNVMTQIIESVEPAGMVGLDKLYCHMIKSDLETLVNSLQHSISNDKAMSDIVNAVNKEASSSSATIPQPLKFYNNHVSKFLKATPKVLDLVLAIGQKQIIRRYIAFELNSSCKFKSKNLESALRTMNE